LALGCFWRWVAVGSPGRLGRGTEDEVGMKVGGRIGQWRDFFGAGPQKVAGGGQCAESRVVCGMTDTWKWFRGMGLHCWREWRMGGVIGAGDTRVQGSGLRFDPRSEHARTGSTIGETAFSVAARNSTLRQAQGEPSRGACTSRQKMAVTIHYFT
jgi:hypothetical protein